MRWLPVVAIGVARVRACGQETGAEGAAAVTVDPPTCAAAAHAEEHGRLGLLATTARDGCGVVVVGVAVGTGSEGVVRPGDRVVAVDGQTVAGWSHGTLVDFVHLAAGTPGSVAHLTVTPPDDPCGTGEEVDVTRTVFADGVPLVTDEARVRHSQYARRR